MGPAELLRHAARARADRVAIVAGATRLSWRELDNRVSAAALALRAAGLRDCDRVTLQLPSGADFVQLYVGALRAGLVAVPVNPAYSSAEVDHIRADAGAALHLDATSGAALLAGAAPGADPKLDRPAEDLAVLLYTSGTSGWTKGAMLSTRALAANLDQLAQLQLVGDTDVVFVALPLCHVFGLNAGLGMALRTGATLVLSDRFDPSATLATMASERVSVVLGVPGEYAAWLSDPGLAAGFASVRVAISGSATLARGVVDGFARVGVELRDGYGLTEAAPVVTFAGRPLPGVEVELRDADGDVVDEGDPGRIHVRGDNLFSGYWPDGHDGPDADGWFGTGDIAVSDDAGVLRLVGRSAELVIVNGFNVYPAEVEAVLAAIDGVAEVAVVGVPDERTGEAVRAYVVPVPGAQLRPDDLLAAAAHSLARFKLPRALDVVSVLPRTVTGKIMKWQLR